MQAGSSITLGGSLRRNTPCFVCHTWTVLFLLSHSLRVDQPCPTQINIRGRAPRKLSETPRFQKIQSHNVQDFFKWRRWLFSIILVLNKGGELVPRDEAPWQKFFFVACVVVTLHQPTMDQKLKLPTPLIDGLFFFLFFFFLFFPYFVFLHCGASTVFVFGVCFVSTLEDTWHVSPVLVQRENS